MPLRLPKSRAEIRRLQSERKRAAVERATRSPFWKKRLPSVNLEKLDDPEVWRKIPILDKDTLRGLSDAQFYGEFCHAEHDGIAEYWRSGGVTGQPLFYPRSFRDIEVGLESFARTIRSGGRPDPDVRDGLAAVRLIESTATAVEIGGEVKP